MEGSQRHRPTLSTALMRWKPAIRGQPENHFTDHRADSTEGKTGTQDGDPQNRFTATGAASDQWLTSDKTKEQIFYESGDVRYTRNKLGCYMAQQASLNNIPVPHWYRDLPWNPRCSNVLKTLKGKYRIYEKN